MWGKTFRYPPLLTPFVYLAMMSAAITGWRAGHPWVAIVCWLPMMHLGHMMLLAFHEAVHYHLSTRRWVNDLRGLVLGLFAFIPLSVYRHVHHFHHARLAREEDAELWPYNQPTMPRWVRLLAAIAELTLSWLVTQIQFVRGLYVSDRMTVSLKRRIAIEYTLYVIVWGGVLIAIAARGWWEEFTIGFVVPALGASMIQSWRKFIEHMGLQGNSPTTAARSIAPRHAAGKALSAMFLNVNHHGAHHRNGRLHFHELPAATERLGSGPDAPPVFPSYFRALLHMLPTLADPRVGGQWLTTRSQQAHDDFRAVIADEIQ